MISSPVAHSALLLAFIYLAQRSFLEKIGLLLITPTGDVYTIISLFSTVSYIFMPSTRIDIMSHQN